MKPTPAPYRCACSAAMVFASTPVFRTTMYRSAPVARSVRAEAGSAVARNAVASTTSASSRCGMSPPTRLCGRRTLRSGAERYDPRMGGPLLVAGRFRLGLVGRHPTAADDELAVHAELPVPVDGAVELVLAVLYLDREVGRLARLDRVGLFLDAVPLDLERVLRLAVVRHVKADRARARDVHRGRVELEVDLRDRDLLARG